MRANVVFPASGRVPFIVVTMGLQEARSFQGTARCLDAKMPQSKAMSDFEDLLQPVI